MCICEAAKRRHAEVGSSSSGGDEKRRKVEENVVSLDEDVVVKSPGADEGWYNLATSAGTSATGATPSPRTILLETPPSFTATIERVLGGIKDTFSETFSTCKFFFGVI